MKNFYFTISGERVSSGLPGESAFYKNGIYNRIPSDISSFNKKTGAIIGDGLYALENAAVLSDICGKIYIINEGGRFFAPQSISSKILSLSSVFPLYHTSAEHIISESDRLTGLLLRDKTTGLSGIISCSFILSAQDVYGRISPSVDTVTTCHGIDLPLD